MRLGTGKILEPKPLTEVIMVAMGITAAAFLARQFGETKAGDVPIWTINNGCFGIRADLCFDMHTAGCLLGEDTYTFFNPRIDPTGEFKRRFEAGELRDLTEEYKKTGVQVVTLDGHDDTLEYPLAEVIENTQSNYFTLGAAYMIAYAMLCGVKTYHLFGFDFTYGDEDNPLEPGRACLEYWLGRAAERGAHFCFPNDTTLHSIREMTKKGMYGYGKTQPIIKIIDGKPKVIGYERRDGFGESAARPEAAGRRDLAGSLRDDQAKAA